MVEWDGVVWSGVMDGVDEWYDGWWYDGVDGMEWNGVRMEWNGDGMVDDGVDD